MAGSVGVQQHPQQQQQQQQQQHPGVSGDDDRELGEHSLQDCAEHILQQVQGGVPGAGQGRPQPSQQLGAGGAAAAL